MRRELSVVVVLAGLIVPLTAAQDAAPPPPVVASPTTGPLHVLQCNGNVRAVASIGEDGTLLVDTGYGATADEVREALAELGGDLPRIIVNTHGDGDHVGGNPVLGHGAVVIAQPDVRRRMGRYFALPPVDTAGTPAVLVTAETTLHFNDEDIRLLPVPGGHTAGDMVVHFTASRVACLGDLVLLGAFPNADPARGGDARRLIEVLRWLHEALPEETTLIAAHDGAMTMADLDAYIEMVEGTVAAVAAEVAQGRTLAEIIERNPLAPWREWEQTERGLTFAGWTTEIHAALTGSYRRSICAPITEALVEDGVEAAIARYRSLKKDEPESWGFGENELNMLGYQLLARDRVDDAIAVFELNVEVYPEAFNTYDSLAEACMTAGRNEAAIANYEKSLDINPDNTNAVTMLARLRGE